MKTQIITFLNQKGGVGKTSCCHHLAGALLQLGRRVLLVDNDPQASLTQGIKGPEATERMTPVETIAAAYCGLRPLLPSITWAGPATGIDLVPGHASVTAANRPDPWAAPREQQECLRTLLADAGGRHDLVLIDCPPNLHLCSWAALLASDWVVVPVQPEDYGAQGLAPVLQALDRVRMGPNPGLRLAGYLVTMVGRTALAKVYEGQLREIHGTLVFGATVPRLVAYTEAIAARAPVSHHLPRSAAAEAMRAVAEELLDRVGLAAARSSRRGAAS